MTTSNEPSNAAANSNSDSERRRIKSGPAPDEKLGAAGVDKVVVHCPGNAAAVLDRTRQVLDAVLGHMQDGALTVEEWRNILPVWFVAASATERSPKDIDPWEAELSRIPREQWFQWVRDHPRPVTRDRWEEEAWSISEFVYWFGPEKREWWWWDAHVQDADTLIVDVVFQDDYSYGALVWLLKTAGATSVESTYGIA